MGVSCRILRLHSLPYNLCTLCNCRLFFAGENTNKTGSCETSRELYRGFQLSVFILHLLLKQIVEIEQQFADIAAVSGE
jgi:hypothetical protein